MWILFTIWFLAIALLALVVLRMAHDESHFGTFSSWFPDDDNKGDQARKVEQKRARVVATGIQYAPQSGIAPGATAGAESGEKARIETKSSVVEVRAMRQAKATANAQGGASRLDAHGLPQASRVNASAAANSQKAERAVSGASQRAASAQATNRPNLPKRPAKPRAKKQSASEREVASPLLAGLVEETEAKKASEEES